MEDWKKKKKCQSALSGIVTPLPAYQDVHLCTVFFFFLRGIVWERCFRPQSFMWRWFLTSLCVLWLKLATIHRQKGRIHFKTWTCVCCFFFFYPGANIFFAEPVSLHSLPFSLIFIYTCTPLCFSCDLCFCLAVATVEHSCVLFFSLLFHSSPIFVCVLVDILFSLLLFAFLVLCFRGLA